MAEETPVGKRATAIESQLKDKLFNKKYYRSVNIDIAEEAEQTKKKASSDEDNAAAGKTSEDYKAILKGMGFNVD